MPTRGKRVPSNDAARVHFVKHLVDPDAFRFEGTTSGAAPGTLTSQILAETSPETDRFRFLRFRWTVAAPANSSVSDTSFVAETQGTLDKITGEVVMTGTVVSGWKTGTSVLERGRLTDAATFTFEGDLIIIPT
jgi:hypothetical protein